VHLCHSTVDNSFCPGNRSPIGWLANRDLNVGAIINLSPDLSASPMRSRWTKPPCGRSCLAGDLESSMPPCCWMGRPSDRTASRRHSDSRGLWPGWRQFSITLHGLGFGSLLERVCRQFWKCRVRRFYDPRLNDTNKIGLCRANKRPSGRAELGCLESVEPNSAGV